MLDVAIGVAVDAAVDLVVDVAVSVDFLVVVDVPICVRNCMLKDGNLPHFVQLQVCCIG